MQLVQISSYQITLTSNTITEAELVEVVQTLCGGFALSLTRTDPEPDRNPDPDPDPDPIPTSNPDQVGVRLRTARLTRRASAAPVTGARWRPESTRSISRR